MAALHNQCSKRDELFGLIKGLSFNFTRQRSTAARRENADFAIPRSWMVMLDMLYS